MDHREAAQRELAERAAKRADPMRKFRGVDDYTVKRAMKLSPEEFDKLGTPMLKGDRCNCKDGGNMVIMGWDNYDCTRCGGSQY